VSADGSPEPGGEVRPAELAGVEMLACLPPAALRDLATSAERRRFGMGDVVFNEGDPGHSLHVVSRGLLKVVRPSLDDATVLDRLDPGKAFGELAVLNAAPRLASVIAVEPSETVEIGGCDLERVLEHHPAAVRRMLGALARSLTLTKEELARRNVRLEEEVQERTADLRETQLEVVRRLGQVAESRDFVTGLHITRMSRISALLGRSAGLSAAGCDLLLHAAPMHDIGKIGIPDSVLLKPGPLNPAEWELMKRHTLLGAELLSGSRSPVVQLGEVIALTHHERWDGHGYPHGLVGDTIPLEGRICAVADVLDALVSDRPYKHAWPVDDAIEEIADQAGRQFDPTLVELFIRMRPEVERLLEAEADTVSTRRDGAGTGARR
jgi:HD-GYP domain-containing protein (c-di-GMP phosphodiesterase class II)